MTSLTSTVPSHFFSHDVPRHKKAAQQGPQLTSLRAARLSDEVNALRLHIETDVEILSELTKQKAIPTGAVPSMPSEDVPADVRMELADRRVLSGFIASDGVLSDFMREYNGTGLKAAFRSMSGAAISRAEALDLLGTIVEDALVAVTALLSERSRSSAVALNAQDELLLQAAIAERIPRIYLDEEASKFGARLVDDLKAALRHGQALAIDDGAVTLDDGKIRLFILGAEPVRFHSTLVGLASTR